ncbi:MAG TPA: cyclase family protein [Pirellulaceae bacterium]|nr:cyclase family protein [Pirellulaceae bacterium]HMO91784.1 cyclase family protein [Pirellulaceae bacterium]HMP69583.1 cyclase family protein [Pirellulaceae bacterium]
MIINLETQFGTLAVDSSTGVSLAIELEFNGPQPIHFGVPPATSMPVQMDGFIGDTTRNGPCNVRTLNLTPHCNGTHTESVGHILNECVSINRILNGNFFLGRLVTLQPVSALDCQETYEPQLERDDLVVTCKLLEQVSHESMLGDALMIRTLPNTAVKRSRNYLDGEPVPFLTNQAIEWVTAMGIRHLLVDFPSIDRMFDQGLLSNHHRFWNIPLGTRSATPVSRVENTITEMIYVPDDLDDGLFLLDLQIPAFASDAAPSRPIVYRILK